MTDTRGEQERVQDKLLGSTAEAIFELLHSRELHCQVFRTGQEVLYPHLLDIAQERKQRFHEKYKTADAKKALTELKTGHDSEPPAQLITNILRWLTHPLKQELASSPDFTVVTPAGRILEFEVKFRPDGMLEKTYEQRYIHHHPFVRIFMLSSQQPRIRILESTFQKEWHDEAKRLQRMSEAELREEYARIFETDAGDKDMVEEIALARARGRAVFREIERNERNEMVIEQGLYDITLDSERLVYPKSVLEKYDMVVQEWLRQ